MSDIEDVRRELENVRNLLAQREKYACAMLIDGDEEAKINYIALTREIVRKGLVPGDYFYCSYLKAPEDVKVVLGSNLKWERNNDLEYVKDQCKHCKYSPKYCDKYKQK